jgi:uncharacterized membrane protein YkoI
MKGCGLPMGTTSILDRRSLILGLAASLMLPAIDAFAAGKDKDKGGGKGGNGGGNNGGGNNGGGNNGGSNNGGGNNGGTNNGGTNSGSAGGAAKSGTNGNANGAANGNANQSANANANSTVAGSQSADVALEAVESGKAMPLRDIQALIEPQYPGVLIEAQLQRRGAAFFYDLTVLSPQGRVYVVTVEAATGLVLGR